MRKDAARPESNSTEASDSAAVPGSEDTVSAESLFQGRNYVRIDLHGVCYELRLTKRHRLLLQKLTDSED